MAEGSWRDLHYFGGNRLLALRQDKFKCRQCGMTQRTHRVRFGQSLGVDHINGLGRFSLIKDNRLENLQTLCCACHGSKDNQHRGKVFCKN